MWADMPATPPNPRSAAMIAITKKVIAVFSIDASSGARESNAHASQGS